MLRLSRPQLRLPAPWSYPTLRPVAAWVPALGPTGATLCDDAQGRGNGAFGSTTAWGSSNGVPITVHDDTVNSRIVVANTAIAVSTALPFTIFVRFYLRQWQVGAFTTTYPIVVNFRANTASAYQVALSNSASYLGVHVGSSATWATLKSDTAAATILGRWWNVALTYNGAGAGTAGNFALYMDGVPTAMTAAGGYAAITNGTTLGGPVSAGSGASYFPGNLAATYLFNRALTAGEVALLHRDYFAPLRKRTANTVKSRRFNPALLLANQ